MLIFDPVSYTHLDVYKRQVVAMTISTIGDRVQTRAWFSLLRNGPMASSAFGYGTWV